MCRISISHTHTYLLSLEFQFNYLFITDLTQCCLIFSKNKRLFCEAFIFTQYICIYTHLCTIWQRIKYVSQEQHHTKNKAPFMWDESESSSKLVRLFLDIFRWQNVFSNRTIDIKKKPHLVNLLIRQGKGRYKKRLKKVREGGWIKGKSSNRLVYIEKWKIERKEYDNMRDKVKERI